MSHDRYDIHWVGRCHFDDNGVDHDKVWGWFFYKDSSSSEPVITKSKSRFHKSFPDHCYVFWARRGKTPNFKKHTYNEWNIRSLVNKKLERKYVQITNDELLELWPNLYEDFDNKFIMHILAENL
jgi:hypothetical protein